MTTEAIINFETVLKESAKLPYVKIDRADFLKSALAVHFNEDTIQKAISVSPAYAGITTDAIKKIANSCIKYETLKVTGLSFAAGIPGGLAMAGTVPADLIQYFAHILRIVQKLIYLYGWQELFDENGNMDDETGYLLMLFFGVMFGVHGATNAIVKIAEASAQKTTQAVAQKAFVKGMVSPIVQKFAADLEFKAAKSVFSKSISKIIPLLGGFASGAVTFVTYRPMAIKLRKHLATLKLADTEFYK